MNITFKTHENFLAFMGMAEGQWLNYRDDNQEPEMSLFDRLMTELNQAWSAKIDATRPEESQYPMTLPLSLTTVESAESVLENCLEYTLDWEDGIHPEDDECIIRKGEVTIE